MGHPDFILVKNVGPFQSEIYLTLESNSGVIVEVSVQFSNKQDIIIK